MKHKLQILVLLCLTGLCSCQRMVLKKVSKNVTTSALIVPVGFNWENSRTIRFTVNVTDSRFGTARNRILIYDGDPSAGAKLILNGFATNKTAYTGNLYLANTISSVYVVKIAVNNTSVTSIVQVGTSNVNVTMGI